MALLERVIGHRGACGYAPENTIISFAKAKELGCSKIEFDVMLNLDGEAFIFHDENLKRTTNGLGQFAKATTKYIQELDAGRWFARKFKGQAIPSLKETLSWIVENDMSANIEIKPTPGKTLDTAMATLMSINQYWPPEKPLPLVSSFDIDALFICRDYSPELPLGLLLDKWDKNWLEKAEKLDGYSVHLPKEEVTKKRVKSIKEHGYKVYVYTINQKRRAQKLFKWGVDAVFSDYPDKLGE